MTFSNKHHSLSTILRERIEYDIQGSILATLTIFIFTLFFILIPRYLYLLRLNNELIRTNAWLDHVEKILDDEIDSRNDDIINTDTI